MPAERPRNTPTARAHFVDRGCTVAQRHMRPRQHGPPFAWWTCAGPGGRLSHIGKLIERRTEGGDQLRRQLLDKAHLDVPPAGASAHTATSGSRTRRPHGGVGEARREQEHTASVAAATARRAAHSVGHEDLAPSRQAELAGRRIERGEQEVIRVHLTVGKGRSGQVGGHQCTTTDEARDARGRGPQDVVAAAAAATKATAGDRGGDGGAESAPPPIRTAR